jgi:hypothetical protein
MPDTNKEIESIREALEAHDADPVACHLSTIEVSSSAIRSLLARVEEVMWQPWATAPRDGEEILIRYVDQGNVKRLVSFFVLRGYWKSKGEPLLGLDNQNLEWLRIPAPALSVKG